MGARLSTDASTLRSLVGDALALMVQNIATVVTGLIMSFSANWKLAFIILVPIPLIGLQEFLQFKFVQGFSGDVKVSSISAGNQNICHTLVGYSQLF